MKRLVLVLALAACSTDLTPEATQVRQISSEQISDCQYLGQVSGEEYFGLTPKHDAASAHNKMRNQVAAQGGNAFLITQTNSDDDSTFVLADAYKC